MYMYLQLLPVESRETIVASAGSLASSSTAQHIPVRCNERFYRKKIYCMEMLHEMQELRHFHSGWCFIPPEWFVLLLYFVHRSRDLGIISHQWGTMDQKLRPRNSFRLSLIFVTSMVLLTIIAGRPQLTMLSLMQNKPSEGPREHNVITWRLPNSRRTPGQLAMHWIVLLL